MNKEILLNEWKKILAVDCVYIYGAAWGAKELYGWFKKLGYSYKVKGFLVTNESDNPKVLCDLPVLQADSLRDKEATILVPHMGDYRKQINEHLKNLNFINVQNIGVLYSKTRYISGGGILPSDEDDFIIPNTSKDIIYKYRFLRKMIVKSLKEGNPDFGNYKPYQSMDRIGLDGIRPTIKRITDYRLLDYLKKDMNVLDIGCNTGFLDMEIAEYVKTVTGIEYDGTLQNIGAYVAKTLEVENVTFLNKDVKEWFNSSYNLKCKYDAIFSFAVHHWIDMDASEYVNRLCEVMNDNALIWIESHGKEYDPIYVQIINEFIKRNFYKIIEADIKDDQITSRDFVLLKR